MKLIINFENLKNFCDINDYILIKNDELKKENIYLNFVYATNNNFIKKKVYPDDMPLIMNKNVWDKLKKLNNDLKEKNMCITIYDSFRPMQIQKIFWESFYEKFGFHNELLVANPNKYGTHNIKLNAIDIVPTNIDGSKIELPCEFDDFTGKANINFDGCSDKAKQNRNLLIKLAKKNGLIVNPDEWWHYIDENLHNMNLNNNYNNTNLIPKELDKTFKID